MHAMVLMLFLAAPPTEQQSFPLGSTRPEEGGFFLYGGPLYGGAGAGWQFRDGSRVDVSPRGVAYSRILYDTGYVRCDTVSGSWPGTACETYLRDGWVVVNGPGRIAAIWYPFENVHLSFGVDLLAGRRGWGWQVSF
jgi:hypothetical protein